MIQNLEFLNNNRQSSSSIAELHERNLIQPGSPYWWSTDYAPDPREFLSFEDFYARLVDIGDGYLLYPHPQVPMTVLDLEVEGLPLRFMVTARPYHEREITHSYGEFDIHEIVPLDKARHHIGVRTENYEPESPLIPLQCLPHVRGLFIEARNTHLFWSVIHPGYGPKDFRDKIRERIEEEGIAGIRVDDFTWYSFMKTYTDAHEEATQKAIIWGRKQIRPDFRYKEVSRLEYCEGWQNNDKLAVKYPVRIDGLGFTLPVLVAALTHARSKVRKPVALGIESESGIDGKGYGLWAFRDRVAALAISQVLTRDFEVEVDVLLRTARAGSPLYERISGPDS